MRVTGYKYRYLAILIIFVFPLCSTSMAQDLLDDTSSSLTLGDSSEQFTEKIDIISRSGKIFILTNNNQLLSKGDFITMSLRDQGPVARAVVAKNHKGRAGIKILKVYSLQRWAKLARGTDVDIIRGDDSALFKPKKEKKVTDEEATIAGEEDLFNDTGIIEEDELGDFYADNRLIKPDNMVSIGYAQFSFVNDADTTGDTLVNNQFNYAYGYQFADNYWVEGLFGRVQVDGFPRAGEQTIISNLTARLKYTIKAPLFSFFLPYVGVQTFLVSSPNAGVVGDGVDEVTAALEKRVVDDLEKTQLVFGFTFLRRLVPGWFFKADVGNDIFSAGFAIEF